MNESILLSALLVVQIVLAAGIFAALPTWSRPEHFFSITVPGSFRGSPEGRAILLRYRLLVGGVATVSLVALFLATRISQEHLRLLASVGAATGIGLVGYAAAFLHGRRGVRSFAVEPTPVREAALTAQVERGLSRMQWIAFLVPLALIAGAAVALLGIYPSLPERIPTHFNLQGEADRWSDTSVVSLLLPLAIAAALSIFLVFLTQWTLRSLPVRTADEAALALDVRRRTAIVELLGAIMYLTATIFIVVSVSMVVPANIAQPLVIAVLILSLMTGSGLTIWFLIRHGSAFLASQRGAESGPDGSPIGDRTEDRHWKLGLIYYNPDDPAVWVEKRIGIGYTNNMARSESWVMLAGLVLFLGLIVLGAVLIA